MRFTLLALLVRFGGSHRTGQAASLHRNKHKDNDSDKLCSYKNDENNKLCSQAKDNTCGVRGIDVKSWEVSCEIVLD